MADSAAFCFVCEALEQGSDLDRLETRGTVRLALKQAGLSANDATPDQLAVVVEKLLPGELAARGIEDGAALCDRIRRDLGTVQVEAGAGDTPEAVFARLGGS